MIQASGPGAPDLDISVVVPSFNENDSIPELTSRLAEVLDRITPDWEVWYIDDGSSDDSVKTLHALHERDPRFKLVRFRRNYGKSAALAIGFGLARGRHVITMDADLQDDPAEIPNLLAKLDEGFDMVSGWKKKRYDPISKTLPSRFFNFVTGKMSGIDIHDFNCGLKAYRYDVVKSVKIYGEMHRYIPVLAKMAGFSVAEIPVLHHPRKYGKTKFGLSRFFKGFLDLLTVMFTSRYTQRPLHVFGTIGSIMMVLGFFINSWLTIEWLMGYPVSNRPMLLLGILLMLIGIQLISTGLIAEMITKSDSGELDYSIREILP
ncbi:MAG: glycosyltransferase family 2 protein [Bacteroidia bacterium]|nr:glycosyltransferase family 2 protein [Bacteroidia bacterium]